MGKASAKVSSIGMSLIASNCARSPGSATTAAAHVPSGSSKHDIVMSCQTNGRGVGHRSRSAAVQRVAIIIAKGGGRANIRRGSAAENRRTVRTVRNLEGGNFDAFQHDGPDQ